jgi:hypothetical protein
MMLTPFQGLELNPSTARRRTTDGRTKSVRLLVVSGVSVCICSETKYATEQPERQRTIRQFRTKSPLDT